MYNVLAVVDVSPLRVGAMPVSPVQMNRAGRIHVDAFPQAVAEQATTERIGIHNEPYLG